jgi:hypothetical protein
VPAKSLKGFYLICHCLHEECYLDTMKLYPAYVILKVEAGKVGDSLVSSLVQTQLIHSLFLKSLSHFEAPVLHYNHGMASFP